MEPFTKKLIAISEKTIPKACQVNAQLTPFGVSMIARKLYNAEESTK